MCTRKISRLTIYQFRLVRRYDLFFLQLIEVDRFEEGLMSDIPGHGVRHPEPLGGVLLEQQQQDVLGLAGEKPREVGGLVTNGPEQLVLVAAVEGALANEHLIEEDAEAPPVHAVGVLHALDDLENVRIYQMISWEHGERHEIC